MQYRQQEGPAYGEQYLEHLVTFVNAQDQERAGYDSGSLKEAIKVQVNVLDERLLNN